MVLAQSLVVVSCLLGPGPRADAPFDADRPPRATPAIRAGAGLVFTGGAAMLVGAGVLVPLSLSRATRAVAPDPADYTAVAPFERDLYRYELELYRASQLGIAGAITSIAGATLFVAGAITWGVGRRVARRHHLAMVPGRGALHATFSVRF